MPSSSPFDDNDADAANIDDDENEAEEKEASQSARAAAKDNSVSTEVIYGLFEGEKKQSSVEGRELRTPPIAFSISSFSMSDVTPPIFYCKPNPQDVRFVVDRLDQQDNEDERQQQQHQQQLEEEEEEQHQQQQQQQRRQDYTAIVPFRQGRQTPYRDPFFRRMNEQRKIQYREELEGIFKEAVESTTRDEHAVRKLSNSTFYVTFIGSWMLSFTCFLPLLKAKNSLFIGSPLEAALWSPPFQIVLVLSIGCGVPKFLDLIASLLISFSLNGLTGANFGFDLINIINTVPHIVFLYLSLSGTSYEALYICLSRWQMCGVGIIAINFFLVHIPDICNVTEYLFIAGIYNVGNAIYAEANTSYEYDEHIIFAQTCYAIAAALYLHFLFCFLREIYKLKKSRPGRLLPIKVYVGLFLNAIIVLQVTLFHGGQIFLPTVRVYDFGSYTIALHVVAKAFIVACLTFLPFHLSRMEKARIKEMLFERVENGTA